MALKLFKTVKKTVTIQINDVVTSATPETVSMPIYARIERMAGTKDKQRADVSFYDFDNRDLLIETKTFSNIALSLDGPNFIQQAYAALKSLPEFAGAEDV